MVSEKVYKILRQSDVWLEGNKTHFSLYPGDYIICEETERHGIVRNVYTHKIKTIKFKMSGVGFTTVPKEHQTLNLKKYSDGSLKCGAISDRRVSLEECVKNNVIEDITISYFRDQKLDSLLYEEE
jgi:hypothetical protein